MKKLTVEDLLSSNSIQDAITIAETYYPKYVSKPRKPTLKTIHTSTEAKFYTEDLAQWEKEMESFYKHKKEYEENRSEVQSIIEEYLKLEANLAQVPEYNQERVWGLAYQKGHSDGYYEVYQNLCELIELFV